MTDDAAYRRRAHTKAQTIALMQVENLCIDVETDALLTRVVDGEITIEQAIAEAHTHVRSRLLLTTDI